MDSARANDIKRLVEQALASLPQGLRVDVSHGSFGDHAVKLTVEVSEILPDGNAGTQEAEAFTRNAVAIGLDPSILFKEISHKISNEDASFKIIGYNERSTKMPIIIEGMSSKRRYKVSVEQLKRVLPS